tara:strand:- start:276 stop:479 length:204 start_codon:yes stop_codon:yes gene_type:complete
MEHTSRIIEVEGKIYQIKRKFPEHRINLKKGSIDDLKLYYHCDTVFKAQNYLWLCNEIKNTNYEEIE